LRASGRAAAVAADELTVGRQTERGKVDQLDALRQLESLRQRPAVEEDHAEVS
jgi:hypothetical protein